MRDTAEARLYLQTPAREAETDSRRVSFGTIRWRGSILSGHNLMWFILFYFIFYILYFILF